MTTSPLQQYHKDLIARHFVEDPAQERAIVLLDGVYDSLIAEVNAREHWARIFRKLKLIQGCYLWGSVGTGKSYLMSTFFHCLPFEKKLRLHFHEFMQQIHAALNELQGNKDPLKIVAKQWAQKTHVLCFDEFFVKDIADAMTLFNILKALFAEGICLIATSNVPLDDLYKNGLQRDRFLPAIKLLHEHVTEIEVDNHVDYRLRHSRPAHTFLTPLNEETHHQMMEAFHYYANNEMASGDPITIHDRPIQTVLHTKSILWCTFHELCETLRSTEDYLLIAQQFSLLLISEVKIIPTSQHDVILRFINLIDVMYDNHILLFISAEAALDKLYQGESLSFEFRRAKSRLIEMDTKTYLEECKINAAK